MKENSVANAMLLVANSTALTGKLRYNERYLRVEWTSAPPWSDLPCPHPLEDSDAVECAKWMAHTEKIAFTETVLRNAITTVAQQHRYDGVREYLTALKWDWIPRIKGWLTTYLGVEDTEYSRAVGKAHLISAVARALKPGCQVDHMLVIKGSQGIGKSRAIAALGGEFYANLSITPSDKDTALVMRGPWIIEWADLAFLSRRKSEAIKAFLSRKEDRLRLPYERTIIDLPRSCIVIGSTNENVCVTNSSGNRRYWLVVATKAKPDEIAATRDQLWAEAVIAYQHGDIWWFTQEQEALVQAQQEKQLKIDAWEPQIKKALHAGDLREKDFVTIADFMKVLEIPASAQHSGTGRRIARIMNRLGWSPSRRTIESVKVRGYFRPGTPTLTLTNPPITQKPHP